MNKLNAMKGITVKQAIDELLLHGLIEKNGFIDGDQAYSLSKMSQTLIATNLLKILAEEPQITDDQLEIQALILTVLKMGYVCSDSTPVYVNVLKNLLPPRAKNFKERIRSCLSGF